MKKNNKNNLNSIVKDNFEKAILYVKEIRNYIYFVSFIFILGIALGFALSGKLIFLDEILKSILLKTANLSGIQLILYIFTNNLNVAFSSLVFGVLLGIIPIFYALSNGVILGYVFSKLYNISGISEFWRILPHGIFELPAIIISLAIGLKFGFFIFSPSPKKEFFERFFEAFRVFIFIVVPLLVIAAIIEGSLIIFLK
jgi:stage II sporulation protein M